MSLRKELDTASVRKPKRKHKPGWEPGFHAKADGIELVVEGDHSPTSDVWRQLLVGKGYDPDDYQIDPERGVEHREWQQAEGGDFLQYTKFRVLKRRKDAWNVDHLVAQVSKRRAIKPKPLAGNAALVVNLADWQAGANHGGGVKPLLERIQRLGPAVVQRWKHLKRCGVPLDTLYVHSLGDMVESCDNFYAQQTYTVELNAEEQREFVIAALDQLLEQWLGLAPRIAVYAIPGNHGENRKGGKSFTDFRDNVDVGVWVNLAHAYSKNPERYGHVQIHTPEAMNLALTYEHDGFVTCLAHGHQAIGGGDPQKKMENWWKGQMYGDRPAGSADLLVSGHWHHTRLVQQGPKTHIMCPALCGDQAWFREGAGLTSPPGTLTYALTGDGWSNLELLS